MKLTSTLLYAALCVALPLPASAQYGAVPNGDFESPAGAAGAWVPVSGGGVYAFSYPATGGNPGGFGVLDNTGGGGGFGIWVANNGAPIPLATLGLEAGKSYTFLQDMKLLAGTKIGGFKVDFFTGATNIGSTGDVFPAGGSNVWATYEFSVNIKAGTDGIKLVPLWGANSSVAYDNIRIKEPEPFRAAIKTGSVVTWTASNGPTYQLQESSDQVNWVNLGPLVAGASTVSTLDETPSAFYQVREVVPGSSDNLVANAGFEEPDGNSLGALSWNIAVQPNSGASMSVVSAHGAILPQQGNVMLKIESMTPASGPVAPPNTDVRSTVFSVEPGVTYNLSFYAANPVKIGGANPQYHVFFYNEANGVIGAPLFRTFESAGAAWTRFSRTVTPPEEATKMTVGWIQSMGAGNGWHWVTLIDDVVLSSGEPGPDTINILPAAATPGYKVTWNTTVGTNYQFQTSVDLSDWFNVGSPTPGTGGLLNATYTKDGPMKFGRAKIVP